MNKFQLFYSRASQEKVCEKYFFIQIKCFYADLNNFTTFVQWKFTNVEKNVFKCSFSWHFNRRSATVDKINYLSHLTWIKGEERLNNCFSDILGLKSFSTQRSFQENFDWPGIKLKEASFRKKINLNLKIRNQPHLFISQDYLDGRKRTFTSAWPSELKSHAADPDSETSCGRSTVPYEMIRIVAQCLLVNISTCLFFNERLISQKMWFQIVLSSKAVTKPNLAGKQPRIRHKHDAVHMPFGANSWRQISQFSTLKASSWSANRHLAFNELKTAKRWARSNIIGILNFIIPHEASRSSWCA